MKPIPSQVRIKGLDWKIKIVSSEHRELATDDEFANEGAMCLKSCTLYISDDLSSQAKWAVFWHEVLHAISVGFRKLDLTDEMPVECVSAELFSVMRNIGLL